MEKEIKTTGSEPTNSILLPTDNDIEQKYPMLSHFTQEHKIMRAYLIEGAKWMRDEIKKNNHIAHQFKISENETNERTIN